MLIYLNRTGFNGLFRVNARGAFNVPAGRYERPRIADREQADAGGRGARQRASASRLGIVRTAPRSPSRGDFVYFDPPYAPLSRTAELHVVHGAALRRGGSAAPAADRHRAGRARLPRAAEQLDRRRDRRALRAQRRGARRRAARHPGAGAAGHQQQRGAARPGRGISDHEPVGGDPARRCLNRQDPRAGDSNHRSAVRSRAPSGRLAVIV